MRITTATFVTLVSAAIFIGLFGNLLSIIGSIIGTLGCAHLAAKRNRNEWFAAWGFIGLIGWAGVAIFLKDKSTST